ncbi:MAG: hypothetical protein ACRDRL_14360 [Sciscionella sp.]
MTTSQAAVFQQINAALDMIQQELAVANAQPPGVERCLRLAELADAEAAWWAELSEHTRLRVCWRAAQAAREYALQTVRLWRQQATAYDTGKPVPASQLETGAV